MDLFLLEDESFFIEESKEYFREVLKCYQNECYRSCIVSLHSLVLYDLVKKLKYLSDEYNEEVAEQIISEIESRQNKSPSNPDWEQLMINKIFERKIILEAIDKHLIEEIRNKRNLSAHPAYDRDFELYTPNKHELSGLLQKCIKRIFLKSPLTSNKILKEMLEYISSNKIHLKSYEEMKSLYNSRYNNFLNDESKLSIIKSLYKLVFFLEDENCKENRKINGMMLEIFVDENKLLAEKIKIKAVSSLFDSLIQFLLMRPRLYKLVDDDTKVLLLSKINSNLILKVNCFFVHKIENHLKYILDLTINESSDYYIFEPNLIPSITDILKKFKGTSYDNYISKIVSIIYKKSNSFRESDISFRLVEEFIDCLESSDIRDIRENSETNSQICGNRNYIEFKALLDSKHPPPNPQQQHQGNQKEHY